MRLRVLPLVSLVLLCSMPDVHAQSIPGGCRLGQPNYMGDFARNGSTYTLLRTGSATGSTGCQWVLRMTLTDEPRFHSNPYATQWVVSVMTPQSTQTTFPYVIGQKVYDLPINVVQLPCNPLGYGACADYVGGTCEQTGMAIRFGVNVAGCPGSTDLTGIRIGETYNPRTTNFTPDPNLPCRPGNSADFSNVTDGIYDAVAYKTPDPFNAGRCRWNFNFTMSPTPAYRYSSWLDYLSFRTPHGSYVRLFTQGKEVYTAQWGNIDCALPALDMTLVYLEEYIGQYPNIQTGHSLCPFEVFERFSFNDGVRYSFFTPRCYNQPANSTLVARVNCGGPALEFPAGCPWTADSAASPYPNRTGGVINAPPICSLTTNPGGPIACNDRWGGIINYTFPAVATKTYQVVVHMAETYWSSAGLRVVRIYINGVMRTCCIDPYARGGGRFSPTLFTYTTQGTATGIISVGFDATTDQPSVVGIEVYDLTGSSATPPPPALPSPSPAPVATASPSPAPVATASPSPAPVATASPSPAPVAPPGTGACPNQPDNSTLVARVNSGGPALQYPAGCAWTADSAASPYPNRTGGLVNAPAACSLITNPGGPIACSDRWGGIITYTFPAVATKLYQVVVHMAETYWSAAGLRIVRISINGALQTCCIDPYARGGGRFSPTLFTYTTQGTATGIMSVGFDATTDTPSVVGIEVYDLTGSSTTPSPPTLPSPSPAPVATASPSPAPVATASPSPAPVATASPSPAPVATASPSPAPVATASPSPAPVATASPSPAPVATASPSPAPAATASPSPAPVATASPSPAPVATASPSPAPVATASPSPPPPGTGACPNQPDNSTLVARVNCGGPALQFPIGCAWTADTAASPYPTRTGGIATNAPAACSLITNPGGPIACSDRWGGVLNYTFPATATRSYRVVVHMAETYWSAAGQRVVRIYINGALQTCCIDPYARGGGRFSPTLFTYTTQGATTGIISVGFDATTDTPSVVGIEVYDVTQ